MPCPGGLSLYDCFVLRDQNIKSWSYTRLKHLLRCMFWLKRLTEIAIGTFYQDQNCESAIWQLKFTGHNGRHNAHTCRTFLILIGFDDRTERFKELCSIFFLDGEKLRVGGKFKNAKRKIHFYSKYWKYGVGAPVKRKIEKLWPKSTSELMDSSMSRYLNFLTQVVNIPPGQVQTDECSLNSASR